MIRHFGYIKKNVCFLRGCSFFITRNCIAVSKISRTANKKSYSHKAWHKMDRGDNVRNLSLEKKALVLLAGLILLVILLWKPGEGKAGEKADPSKGAKENQELKTLPKNIRVLIKDTNYGNITHEKVSVVFEEKGTKTSQKQTEEVVTGQAIEFTKDNVEDQIVLEGNKIRVTSIKRGQGNPVYENKLELRKTEKGLVLIQEVPFETYLKGVVPSEMPASYEKEALKAQAVCARTYAYSQILSGDAYPEFEADLDDSVSFQVYLSQPRQETTDLAVEETKGEILTVNNQPISAWYFSTSWGQTTDTDAWLAEPSAYLEAKAVIKADNEDVVSVLKQGESGQTVEDSFRKQIDEPAGDFFEAAEPWYRWSAVLPVHDRVKELWENLVLCGKENKGHILVKKGDEFVEGSVESFDAVKKVEVAERGDGGLVLSLKITTDKQMILIKGQYNIRQILALEGMEVTKNDGTRGGTMQLLPSGFFYVKDEGKDEVTMLVLRGGGFGHGAGLSQNGANAMAKNKWYYADILGFFYKDVKISQLK